MLLILLAACTGDLDPKDTGSLPPATDSGPHDSDSTGRETGPSESTPTETESTPTEPVDDADGDGWTIEAGDCDDTDASVYPGAEERVGDLADNDCDGFWGETSWVLTGPVDDHWGVPSSPGDVDGDGHGDLLVAAPYGEDLAGVTWLFSGADLGSASDDVDAVARFAGARYGDDSRLGEAPTGRVGDLDGDGIDELAYSARYEDVDGMANTGAVWIWRGGGGWSGALSSRDADGEVWSSDAASETGYALQGLGDLDGDGYEDWAAGAPRGGALWHGRVWFMAGGEVPGGTVEDLSVAWLEGEQYSLFGETIGGPTDLDGDGALDVVVGCYYGPGSYPGAVYAWFGPGFPATQSEEETSGLGVAAYSYFGAALATGDVDADGADDLVVGASGTSEVFVGWGDAARPRDLFTSRADIYAHRSLGQATAAADLDLDGDDELVLSAPEESLLWVLDGPRRGTGVDPEPLSRWTASHPDAGRVGMEMVVVDRAPGNRPLVAASADGVVVLLGQRDD